MLKLGLRFNFKCCLFQISNMILVKYIYFMFVSQDLPINIKFCLEGMEESGSEGLDDLVFSQKDTFFKDVDYVCISDNYWLGKTKPCVTYGLRGICYFFIEVEADFVSTSPIFTPLCCDSAHSNDLFLNLQVESSTKDLHSGVFGGSVPECMTDLIALMGKFSCCSNYSLMKLI